MWLTYEIIICSATVKFSSSRGAEPNQRLFAKAYLEVEPFFKLFSQKIQILVHVESNTGPSSSSIGEESLVLFLQAIPLPFLSKICKLQFVVDKCERLLKGNN
jgi:hypothetical protein